MKHACKGLPVPPFAVFVCSGLISIRTCGMLLRGASAAFAASQAGGLWVLNVIVVCLLTMLEFALMVYLWFSEPGVCDPRVFVVGDLRAAGRVEEANFKVSVG